MNMFIGALPIHLGKESTYTTAPHRLHPEMCRSHLGFELIVVYPLVDRQGDAHAELHSFGVGMGEVENESNSTIGFCSCG